ncbi:MCE family protein [Actinomadura sp. KC345]|uniref:MCE family protein n=1 Tax=Actinomadura sp. KC345 TaxID=2530371 RepID=UPI00104C7110|nr:MCE family protein [Actinomadura sp. KC345]TDC55234.1 MCE family protein [Actinomadura sp. KC345]
MIRRHPGRAALAMPVLAITLAGCGFTGVRDLPLPGGADLGDDPYTVKARFANVLNLVPQSAVKVNDVAVGRVVDVALPQGGWTAEVTMKVNGDVELPADAHAELRQSSLLGEKFVQLSDGPSNVPAPSASTGTPSTGTLADGAVIPLSRTNRNPEVEEVLGALSMLLNGGGIAQLRTITVELNRALGGNEAEVRSLLEQARKLIGGLDANKKGITDAIDGMNRLSGTLRARKEQIGVALDDLEPGLAVLAEQRGALVRMLNSLEELSRVAVDTVRRSKDDLIADLRALEPTLRKLSDAGTDLPDALQVLLTYPFTDAVLPAVKGDYLNVYLQVAARPGTEIIPPIAPLPAAGPARPEGD